MFILNGPIKKTKTLQLQHYIKKKTLFDAVKMGRLNYSQDLYYSQLSGKVAVHPQEYITSSPNYCSNPHYSQGPMPSSSPVSAGSAPQT